MKQEESKAENREAGVQYIVLRWRKERLRKKREM
jgi:hypothetical protein